MAGKRQIAEECRVAKVVDRLAADVDHDAGRSVDRPARRCRGVPSRHPLRPAPVEVDRATEIGIVNHVLWAQLVSQLGGGLNDRRDRGPCARSYCGSVAEVIAVAVCYENRVGLNLSRIGGRLRVACEKRVDREPSFRRARSRRPSGLNN